MPKGVAVTPQRLRNIAHDLDLTKGNLQSLRERMAKTAAEAVQYCGTDENGEGFKGDQGFTASWEGINEGQKSQEDRCADYSGGMCASANIVDNSEVASSSEIRAAALAAE
ncbi:hypothetical protein D5S18_23200 [Nocardia panacis]|uniref:Uncharacterized protein n=1 Tax=Nocardia panacis TaxID=2340916 RepID=A0A3A4KAJ4_9NOCA|nr:hypothetical protein [Nocardia panacis]RJO72088.1 hypothetical protein D5S18_23200 [Nocardia panacis]